MTMKGLDLLPHACIVLAALALPPLVLLGLPRRLLLLASVPSLGPLLGLALFLLGPCPGEGLLLLLCLLLVGLTPVANLVKSKSINKAKV